MSPGCVFVNGKFAAQSTTGVQRVAAQLVQALDAIGPALPGEWTLLCPPGANAPALRQMRCLQVGQTGWPLHAWEQWTLPRAARSGLLLNLSGSAPWSARQQACLIHDAAVFDRPEAYSPAFLLWYRALFRHLASSSACLLTVSAFSKDRLTQALGVAPSRFTVVPNGGDHLLEVEADEGALDRLGLRGQRFFLAVGSDNPNKNHARLIAAYAAWTQGQAQPLARLVLVGGQNARVFNGTAAGTDPPGLVRVGSQGDAVLKVLYRHALALVFPSLYEGFGMPPLEAMSQGCPVIAGRAASLPEVCGDAALYVDPLDTAALSQVLQVLHGDPAVRRQLVEAGLARLQSFTWAASARRVLQALPLRQAA